MEKLSVKEIAAVLGTQSDSDAVIDSVVIDSREAGKGSLFVAIAGERFDGHDFVSKVLENGVQAAVCSKIPNGVSTEKLIIVEDTRTALLQIAAYYRSKFEIPVVGLTGSVGKTTTKEMIATVLSAKFNTVFTQGNLNNEIGLPRMCFRIDSSTQAAVLEMGMNHFGEISRLTQTARPTIGLINNIGVSHIENLGSREGILKAKMEILEGMKKNAPLVLNADDEMLFNASKSIENPVVFFGIDNPQADFKAEDIVQDNDSMRFTIKYNGGECEIKLPAIGRHNVLNAAAAFAVGMQLGISPKLAADALAEYTPSGMRQKIVTKSGKTVVEDCYNASPDSIKASLSAFSSMKISGKRIAVLGDMLELGDYSETAHRSCGGYVADNKIDILFAYGTEAAYYVDEAKKKGIETMLFRDKKELTDKLFEIVNEGDAVLFKASRGMKLEEVINELYERWA